MLPKKICYVLNIVFFSNIPSKEARVRLTYRGAGPIKVTDVPAGHFLKLLFRCILLIYTNHSATYMFFLRIVMQTRFYTAEEQLYLSMQCWAHPRHAHPAAHTHAVHAHVRQTHAVHAHVRRTHAGSCPCQADPCCSCPCQVDPCCACPCQADPCCAQPRSAQ